MSPRARIPTALRVLALAASLGVACAKPPTMRAASPDGDGRAPAAKPAGARVSERHLRDGYREMMAGRTLAAIGIFDQAIAAAAIESERGTEALANVFAGLCLAANKRLDEARARHERALALAPTPSRAQAMAHEGLARLAIDARRFEDAAAEGSRAAAAALALRDLAGAGIAVELVLRAIGEDAALARADLTSAVASFAGPRSTASALSELLQRAGVAVGRRSPVTARARFRAALRLAERARDDDLVATALAQLGTVEMQRGDTSFARELLLVALERARRGGTEPTKLLAAANLAQALRFTGDLRGARRLYEEALALARRLGRRSEVGVIISNMARLSGAAGDYARALEGDLEALAIHRETGPARAIATDLNNLGATYFALGRHDDAQKAYVEARALAEKLRALDLLEAIDLNHGFLEKTRGHVAQARARYEAALAALRKLGNELYQPAVQNNLAWLDAEAGRCDLAVPRFAQARAMALRASEAEMAWTTAYGEARCAVKASERAKARRLLAEAADLIERQRAGLAGGARSGQLFGGKTHHVFRDAVELALADGDAKAAFELAERGRARTLLEALAGGRSRAALRGATADALSRVRTAATKVAESERSVALAEVGGDVARARRELEEARRAHDVALEGARAGAPAAASTTRASKVDDIQRALAADEAILELTLLRDGIALMLLRRDRLRAVRSPSATREVRDAVRRFRATLDPAVVAAGGGRWRKPLRALYDALVRPVRADLEGVHRLYVVPSGVLNLVPFAALLDGERALIEDFAIASLPAASALAALRRPVPTAPALVAVGNPRFAGPTLAALPSAEAEARAVASLFPGASLMVGEAATEAALKAELPRADILHLATHGELNARAPLFSALLLAPGQGDDGRFEVHEILRSELRAALVVLSACDSAVQAGVGGGLPAGEELVGLVGALLEAGAASVVASLWPVADGSTRRFFEAFYKALPKLGRAEALRAAQKALRRSMPHPFFWAPFIVVGDGG